MLRLGLLACWLIAVAGAAEPIAIAPLLQRIDLQPEQVREVSFSIHAQPGVTITTVLADCACLRCQTPLPVVIGATGQMDLRFRVTGMRPGVEDILAATTAGILRAQIQIVGPGAGRGIDQLQAALTEAAKQGWRILAVTHDLRGQVRHCGCSQGALGGAGRLARLPELAAGMQPAVPVTWVLSGDADGKLDGVGAVLTGRGWKTGDPTVRVSPDPLPLLAVPGVVAVIPTTDVAIEHRRIIRPVLTDGMAVELLLIDASGAIQARRTMPVDDSLPDDPAWAGLFRDTLSRIITADANPSQACATCHASAYAAWLTTRHARALDSLAPADRTDTCIGCHTTPLTATTLAPMVSCQSCHLGAAAHAAANGQVRTSGTTDCRECHDARHQPGFLYPGAWERVRHGK